MRATLNCPICRKETEHKIRILFTGSGVIATCLGCYSTTYREDIRVKEVNSQWNHQTQAPVVVRQAVPA